MEDRPIRGTSGALALQATLPDTGSPASESDRLYRELSTADPTPMDLTEDQENHVDVDEEEPETDYVRSLAAKEKFKRRLDEYFDRHWDVNADMRGLQSLLGRLDVALKELERSETRNPVTWSRRNRRTMFSR